MAKFLCIFFTDFNWHLEFTDFCIHYRNITYFLSIIKFFIIILSLIFKTHHDIKLFSPQHFSSRLSKEDTENGRSMMRSSARNASSEYIALRIDNLTTPHDDRGFSPTLTSSIDGDNFSSPSYRHFRSLSTSVLTRPFRLRYDNSRHMSLVRSGRRFLLQSQWNLCCGIAHTHTHEYTGFFTSQSFRLQRSSFFPGGVLWNRFNQHWGISTRHDKHHFIFNLNYWLKFLH